MPPSTPETAIARVVTTSYQIDNASVRLAHSVALAEKGFIMNGNGDIQVILGVVLHHQVCLPI